VAALKAAPLHFNHPVGGFSEGQGTGTPTGKAEPSPKPRFLSGARLAYNLWCFWY